MSKKIDFSKLANVGVSYDEMSQLKKSFAYAELDGQEVIFIDFTSSDESLVSLLASILGQEVAEGCNGLIAQFYTDLQAQ